MHVVYVTIIALTLALTFTPLLIYIIWLRYTRKWIKDSIRTLMNRNLKGSKHIQKNIHQIYFQEPLPEKYKLIGEKLKFLNPTWTYTLYNARTGRQFIKDNYPDCILAHYECINPSYLAARADLLRYLIMYKRGGVYLDSKSYAIIPFDRMLEEDDEFILAHWGYQYLKGIRNTPNQNLLPKGEYIQFILIGCKGHAYFKATIDTVLNNIRNYDKSITGVGAIGTLTMTGPIPYTKSIVPILNKHKHRIVDHYKNIGLKYNEYDDNPWLIGAHRSKPGHYKTLQHPLVDKDKQVNLNICLY